MARPATGQVTPAGEQVERALDGGFDVAAYNLYYANIKDEVPMVEGVWPEWHQSIQARIGTGPFVGDDLIDDLGVEGAGDALGIDLDDQEAMRAQIHDTLGAFQPSIIDARIRNARGEVIGVKRIPNPDINEQLGGE
jgi:hypothetical protein